MLGHILGQVFDILGVGLLGLLLDLVRTEDVEPVTNAVGIEICNTMRERCDDTEVKELDTPAMAWKMDSGPYPSPA